MKFLGLTSREWIVYGIGASVNGAILGALFHNAGILIINMILLGVNIGMLPYFRAPEAN